MTLGEKQRLFGKLLPRLLDKAQELFLNGVAVGECERSEAAAAWNAANGKGITNSLHRSRLAVDLLLFADTDGDGDLDYLTDTESHRKLGEWWEAQHELCRWGGRFKRANGKPKPDGNHYSLTHEGRA